MNKKLVFRRALMLGLTVLSGYALISKNFVGASETLKNVSGTTVNTYSGKNSNTANIKNISGITNITGLVDTNVENYFDESVIYKLPDQIKEDEMISVIISMDRKPIYDLYKDANSELTFNEYVNTAMADKQAHSIERAINEKITALYDAGVEFTVGEKYDTLIAGFEITIKKSAYETVNKTLANDTLILGDTYQKCETKVVTNDVDVYDTGIFDSSLCDYQGDGVVVAVLDTGLDYTHTAFSPDNFTTTNEAFTIDTIAEKINETTASQFSFGLTAEDVYINKKVPYAYDYADKDTDVAPINSEHGTHVAGIIAGKDDVITGVAPHAQLAIFKVFSDHQDGAKTSWLIAALEDCVVLGVDLINMSLGSGCGFTREVDKENVNKIYDKINECGIELIASAANSYNATMGSTKNGNNGLTSNPDSGTVGSPSTYEAALSVASVEGVKTSYLKVSDTVVYFKEASTNSADLQKSFVDDILKTLDEEVDQHDFEYAVIPGIGRSSDYPEEDSFYQGKIVLVKRGTTTFEDKVRVALKEKGAAGIIIYNNVSGDISMSVGANIGAVCSITQDDGEFLVSQVNKATGTGIISISRDQLAGPFMSDFSSWGPTSDLHIKPEITAHGGQILSAVPGQAYEKLSGTSMAAPNLCGAAALICQYVKYSGNFGENLTAKEVTNIVNQLMMSTADIINDKNGLPSAVRKQGAGLINIAKSTEAEAYLSTLDYNGNKMAKAKCELGDDENKTGVYTMKIQINNISNNSVAYNINGMVLTEGVSTTYTSHSDTTVTQTGYLLDGAKIDVVSVENGALSGKTVTVDKNNVATVEIKISLSDTDKAYLDKSFENGMYVEGFITFEATNGTTVNLSVPFLGFYGDWTQAPIFDEEYYDTHKDEINKGLDDEDKLMADAYATRVIGGLYSDYISTLGTYYFVQDPKATPIAASKDLIAVGNQNKGKNGSTISSIRSVNAGLLRNVKEVYVSIVDDATGEEVYTKLISNQHKSFSSGSSIYASSIEIDYDILEHNLKNNSKYTCTLTAYIDYGTNEDQNNVRNTFVFPFYVDFEAPIVTDTVYRTEYDRTTKQTKLFADLYIYDNHYAMGASIGQITKADPSTGYMFTMNSFGKYVLPVYSQFNSTSVVSVELTDYVQSIKNSCGIKYNADGSSEVVENNNSFICSVYDYAMNSATYEISLPDEIAYMYFNEESKNLSPNETLDLTSVLNVYPTSSWIQVLDFESSDESLVSIVNNTLIAKASGDVVITAKGKDKNGNTISTNLNIHILSEGEDGYVGTYSIPEINKFTLDGYHTLKAYYALSSDERDIGETDGNYSFGDQVLLEMFPSEQVKLAYTLDSYFPENTSVKFKASNAKIATVDDDGVITALAKGSTTIMVSVQFDGRSTLYSARVSITVKDPFNIQSIYLNYYHGLGGVVEIPGDRGITTIQQYAFSNYEYVEKDLENGDVVDEEDPYYIKPMYIGEDTITKVIIPEGVTTISQYAFANMSALEEVVLPSTLTRIGVGAFKDCVNLKTINLESAKFINERAFENCALEELKFSSTVSIGDYAFNNCKLSYVVLPTTAQSVAKGAFYNNQYLTSVTFKASKIKIGSYAFAECPKLAAININAAVVSSYAFYNDTELADVTLGADVAVIGEYAFSGTAVEAYKLSPKNKFLTLEEDGALVLKGEELLLTAPNYIGPMNTITTSAKTISTGAFAGNKKVFYVKADNVKTIKPYAFANCENLKSIQMPNIETIEDYAFYNTDLVELGDLTKLKSVGSYAFFGTDLENVELGDRITIGNYAFAFNQQLLNVTLGNYVTIGENAFYMPVMDYTYEKQQSFAHYTAYNYEVKDSNDNVIETNSYYRYNYIDGVFSKLKTVTLGNNVTIGDFAFYGNGKLKTVNLSFNTTIGNYAFYSCAQLDTIDFTKVKSIGDYAFAGLRTQDYFLKDNVWRYAYEQEVDDGVFINTAYVYSCFAPCFTTANLSGVESIGKGAFMGNTALTSVTFSDNIECVEPYMFANCSKLENVTLKDHMTEIKEYAFYNSGIKSINLDKVAVIGDCAFFNTKINNITLKDNVEIKNQAFYYAKKLNNITNAEGIKTIGDYAFTLSAVESIKLTNAELIGDFAFSQSKLTNVEFGNKLTNLGENPFYGCDIKTFGKEIKTNIGSIVDVQIQDTYELNDFVKVVDGVLYQVIPSGLELVSYPMLKSNYEYTVLNGTTRITATAFAYSKLESVTLNNTLRSIGDKAFYGCENLNVVTFTSYDCPLLEEAYNTQYLSYLNLPITGYMGEYEGLGISKYYMWNVTSNYNNFYFGANFRDYVGKNDNQLIMVRPTNGKSYDTFILSLYFGKTINGNFAPTLDTLKVVALINNLPANVTLSSEDVIVAARQAYNSISSAEQLALVDNYDSLIKAESTLAYLKSREEPDDPVDPIDPTPEKNNAFADFMKGNMVGFILSFVLIVGFVSYIVISKRKQNYSKKSE